MSWEGAGWRAWVKVPRFLRLLGDRGVVAVALRGGNVGNYLGLRQPWIQNLGIRTIIDVGANLGQFAEIAARAFPGAALHCIEPIPECYERIRRRFDSRPRCFAYNIAIADRAGESTMTRNAFSQSSSLLEMDSLHVREFPFTGRGEQLPVRLTTLDEALGGAVLDVPLLLKIDVQGAEGLVIAGGRATLARASVAIIETSYEALYKEQPLFDDINGMMREQGFQYRGALGELRSPEDGRALQADSIFVRA